MFPSIRSYRLVSIVLYASLGAAMLAGCAESPDLRSSVALHVEPVQSAPTVQTQSGATSSDATAPSPPAGSTDDSGSDVVTGDELKECADFAGLDRHDITANHGTDTISVTSDKGVAIKISGNHGNMDLTVNSASKSVLPVLCVFLPANHAKLTAHIASEVSSIYYIARGNHAYGVVEVQQGGKISKSFTAKLSGNHAILRVIGAGERICPDSESIVGNHAQLSCPK